MKDVGEPKEHVRLGARLLILVAMLMVMTAFSQFIRTVVGTLAPILRSDLGLDARLLGLANGGFFIAFLVMQLPLGILFDRHGVRRTTAWLTYLAALGSLLGAICAEPWSFIASRILVGIGSAGYFMGTLVVAGNWFRDRRFVSIVSLVYAVSNLGTLAATAPLSLANEAVGWRTVLVVIALVTVIIAVGIHFFVHDFPSHASIPENAATGAGLVEGWREVWRTPGITPILVMAATAYPSMSTLLATWAAPYLADVYHLDSAARGNLLLLFASMQVLGVLGWGQLAAHRAGTSKVIVGCGAGAVLALTSLALWPSPSLFLAAGLFAASCLLGAFGSLVLMEGRQLFPARIAGRGVTAINLAQVGGSAVLPIVTGAIAGWLPAGDGSGSAMGYRLSFGFIAACLLTSVALYSFWRQSGSQTAIATGGKRY